MPLQCSNIGYNKSIIMRAWSAGGALFRVRVTVREGYVRGGCPHGSFSGGAGCLGEPLSYIDSGLTDGGRAVG